MTRLLDLSLLVALTIFCSCQKQQTEEERNAEIERQVPEQGAAQRKVDLGARQKTRSGKESAANQPGSFHPPQNRSTASFSTFYIKLEPFGAWRETADYGYVWQPREAEQSRSWRPYTKGRWVYTDVAWTWVSEEPFGWAAYHYGRWARLRHIGWVWVPGEEWAPAWVSWRKGDEYIGWAPLPPEARFDRRSGIRNWADNYYDIGPDQYCFVPTRQFGAQRASPTILPPERNVTIVNQTTNVTNITYNNTTIVNQGPDYYELRAHTEQPIEHLRVERRTKVSLEEENPLSVVRGEVLEMPAPVIAKPRPAERPRRVGKAIAQTTVDRGWEAIPDSRAAEKARAKIKSESTPPPDAPPKTFVKPTQPAETNFPLPTSTSAETLSTP